ncbi:hypothetical protein EYC80_006849 [Monilinia laxa]|uniref:Uncharacterized protein n=1 Tax=Monilinia laxa TaxID=61186 RepID=A0A5N6JZK0_MONLA|nr:hypothetical protein EYC80_006849 [Monilinia laxa]
MSSSSSPNTSPWLNIAFPLPVSLENDSQSGSISPLSLSHSILNTPPYMSLDAPPSNASPNSPYHPTPNPARTQSLRFPIDEYPRKYSKQGMVYRAIDEKLDLVRFLQAYESVLAAFGVREDLLAESSVGGEKERERERGKLGVAERIVFRLFWNDGPYGDRSECESVPLSRVDAGSCVTTAAVKSKAQRVTSSEIHAINAIVDEAYEGLHISVAPAIDFVSKEKQMTSTITEVSDVVGETAALEENTVVEIVDRGCSAIAGKPIDTISKKDQIKSAVAEVVEVSVGHVTAGSAIHTTERLNQMDSTFAETTGGSINSGTFALPKTARGTMNENPPTIVSIKPEPDADANAFYEEIMKSPKIQLLRRWGCDRYAEWVQENGKAQEAQDEDAQKEVFRLMELKHRLLPLTLGKLPYTYRITSSTQNHRNSYTSLSWGFDGIQRTEEFLNVKFQWTCEAGTHNITVEPISLDELAADEGKGHRELRNAYDFLEFWDWFVRQSVYFFEGKVRPMHEICLHWLDRNSRFRRAYFQKRPYSNSSEKVKRERSCSRDLWSWRERRTVSGASYVGGKKRCVSGGIKVGNRGKKKSLGGKRCVEEWEDKLEYSSRGLRNVRRKTAVEATER